MQNHEWRPVSTQEALAEDGEISSRMSPVYMFAIGFILGPALLQLENYKRFRLRVPRLVSFNGYLHDSIIYYPSLSTLSVPNFIIRESMTQVMRIILASRADHCEITNDVVYQPKKHLRKMARHPRICLQYIQYVYNRFHPRPRLAPIGKLQKGQTASAATWKFLWLFS